jgi:RES domain-containing protein
VIEAFRLVRSRHSDTAFQGIGTKMVGGRWNFPGTALVYVSSTLALAVLETIVRLNRKYLAEGLVYFRVAIPDAVSVEEVSRMSLPAGWNHEIYSPVTQQIGAAWSESMRTAVLRVPSVITPEDCNYVLNPNHPEFPLITISGPTTYQFDHRIEEIIKKGRP